MFSVLNLNYTTLLVKFNYIDYVNCDFILGSTACVERLWSIAKEILHGPRNRTSPIMVEALLFLRENRRLWSINNAVEATAIVNDNRLSDRQKEKENNLGFNITLIQFVVALFEL